MWILFNHNGRPIEKSRTYLKKGSQGEIIFYDEKSENVHHLIVYLLNSILRRNWWLWADAYIKEDAIHPGMLSGNEFWMVYAEQDAAYKQDNSVKILEVYLNAFAKRFQSLNCAERLEFVWNFLSY